MEEKTCDKCGKKYDGNLSLCPYCSTNSNNLNDYNIRNPFLEMEKNDQQNEITRADLPPKKELPVVENTAPPIVEKENSDILFESKNSIIQEEPKSIIAKSNGQNIDPEKLKKLHNPALDFGDNLESSKKKREEEDKEKKEKEKDKEKKSSNDKKEISNLLVNDFLFLMFWTLAATLIIAFTQFEIFALCHYSFILLLLIIGYRLAASNHKAAGFIGLFVGICMILTILENDVIDMLLGVFLFTHSIVYFIKSKRK